MALHTLDYCKIPIYPIFYLLKGDYNYMPRHEEPTPRHPLRPGKQDASTPRLARWVLGESGPYYGHQDSYRAPGRGRGTQNPCGGPEDPGPHAPAPTPKPPNPTHPNPKPQTLNQTSGGLEFEVYCFGYMLCLWVFRMIYLPYGLALGFSLF